MRKICERESPSSAPLLCRLSICFLMKILKILIYFVSACTDRMYSPKDNVVKAARVRYVCKFLFQLAVFIRWNDLMFVYLYCTVSASVRVNLHVRYNVCLKTRTRGTF